MDENFGSAVASFVAGMLLFAFIGGIVFGGIAVYCSHTLIEQHQELE